MDYPAIATELQNNGYAALLAAVTAAVAPFPLATPAADGAAVADGILKRAAAVAALDALANALNEKSVAVDQPIDGSVAGRFLIKTGIVGAAALVAADTNAAKPFRIVCQTLRDAVLNNQFQSYDLTDVDDKALIDADTDALIAADAMTTDQRDALYALGTVAKPFWQTVGNREIDHGDVMIALGHRWDDLTVPNVAGTQP